MFSGVLGYFGVFFFGVFGFSGFGVCVFGFTVPFSSAWVCVCDTGCAVLLRCLCTGFLVVSCWVLVSWFA